MQAALSRQMTTKRNADLLRPRIEKAQLFELGSFSIPYDNLSCYDYLTEITALFRLADANVGRTECLVVGAEGVGTADGFGVPMRSSFGDSSESQSLNKANQHLTPVRMLRVLLDIEFPPLVCPYQLVQKQVPAITTSCACYVVGEYHLVLPSNVVSSDAFACCLDSST